jgi:hypothetical protein
MRHASQNARPSRSLPRRAVPRAIAVLASVTWALGLASLACAAGCTHVAPYDRGRLAQPSMTAELESVASAHVHAVHEGAAGGGSVSESGCGCN